MDPATMIPMNPRDFLILFSLTEENRHGYGIVKEVDQAGGGVRIDPANLYRSLKRMMAEGLVEESDPPAHEDASDGRRRYYAITSVGREVVKLEAARLAELTAKARSRRLIPDGEVPA